ncbi:MAG: twin-arginine translocation signal domain-containing protein [Halanaeroarchaeum sp.]
MTASGSDGLSRRDVLKGAVAVGGAVGLAACVDRQGSVDVPTGPEDLASLPDRQHAWNAVLDRDEAGNPLPPRHHVLASFDLAGEGPPTAADRRTLEDALDSLNRAYRWGSDGLLFTVGYSPAYFDRFDEPLPASVDLPAPEPLAPFEDPAMDAADALVHLASDHPQVVLRAERALRGETDALNGVDVAAAATEVLSATDRRTGFVGAGLPAEHDDVEGVPTGAVPTAAPMFMGFKSAFVENQASEDRVTIDAGPFAGGTTQHVSQLHLDLDQWYLQDDRYQRVAKMFCPHHAEHDVVEGVGENLGTASGMGQCADPIAAAREYGVVGHSQKMVPVREDGSPIILRRDFDTTDGGRAGLHFVALQEAIADFVRTREAMNGTDVADETAVGPRTNNGILQYLDVVRRGNFLVPPRARRALPTPAGEEDRS